MSGNIQNVNLQKLRGEIDDYYSIASKMHTCLCNVSDDMKKFSTCWTGKRINQLLNVWNQNYSAISDNCFYFAMKIKLILNEIYNQYVSMENGAPKDATSGYGFGGILKVPLTDESNIKFDRSNAEAISKDIMSEVNKANSYLKQLINKLDSMQAYSDSLKTLATTYKSTANSVSQTLSKLCQTMQTEIKKALNDVNITEQYNESDAKRASSIK